MRQTNNWKVDKTMVQDGYYYHWGGILWVASALVIIVSCRLEKRAASD